MTRRTVATASRRLFPFALLLVFIAAAKSVRADDSELLQGKWRVTAAELGSQSLKKFFEDRDAFFVFRGNQLAMHLRTQDVGVFTLKAGKANQPGLIDVKTKAENPMVGIYQINGDNLMMCFDLTGENRPDKFESPMGSFVLLVALRRAGN